MSFCCGASMLGTRGTLKHLQTHIHHVPVLFCPVCQRVDIHYLAKGDYELLADFAQGDGAVEVDFNDYIEQSQEELLENCVNHEDEDAMEVVRSQIDMALDLLQFAYQIEDSSWQYMLKRRLRALNARRNKLLQKH
ncbi:MULTISPECIES: hypothetical protein [unclassified Paenibacillus]|uniref:hypothetical protein n=1 Tax=unclassified Paenibacillus TaxID=185978 RepID=UPI002F3F56B1